MSNGERAATTPLASGGAGAAGGTLNAALVAWIVGSNPELAVFVPAFGGLFQGVLNGIGNLGRTWKSQKDDPAKTFFGTVFSLFG